MPEDPLDLIRSQLEALGKRIERDRGHDFMAQCPVPGHGAGTGDPNPSLHVETGSAGRALLTCHAGCEVYDILDAVGLQLSDLFVGGRGRYEAFLREHGAAPSPRVRSPAADTSPRVGSTQGPKEAKEDKERRERDGRRDQPAEMNQLLEAHAAGRIAVDVEPPPRPPGATEPMLAVLRFFALCVALRRWADMPEPYEVPFAKRWVAAWVGLPEKTVERALKALRRPSHAFGTTGTLVLVREMERRRGQPRGTYVFAPGWLVDAEEVPAALPAQACGVEADDAGRVDERQKVGE